MNDDDTETITIGSGNGDGGMHVRFTHSETTHRLHWQQYTCLTTEHQLRFRRPCPERSL